MAQRKTVRHADNRAQNGSTKTAQARPDSPLEAASPILRSVLVVTALLVVALVLVCLGVLPGHLYVRATALGDSHVPASFVACIYAGDVQAILCDDDPSNDPQALAAVTLQPGVEMPVEGLQRGTYTVAIVGATGSIDPAAGVFVTVLSGSDTHVGFALCANA